MTSLLLIVALSYGLGAIPFSLLVAQAKGVDLRAHGSGNAGATNVWRVVGMGPGALTFALDAGKGLVATLLLSQIRVGGESLAGLLGPHHGAWLQVIAGAAAMAGHVWTVWGRVLFGSWRGGKGVATGAGMLLGLIPVAVGVGVVVFAATLAATRWVSLGSILAAVSLPLTLAAQRAAGASVALPLWGFVLVVPLFIVWTHRTNIRRLLAGTEPRLNDPAGRVASGTGGPV